MQEAFAIHTITLIGAGQVAGHLGRQLHAQGLRIQQVYGRRPAQAKALATAVGAVCVSDITAVEPGADLYILAVSDAAISQLANELAQVLSPTALVVHTSGATPVLVLTDYFARAGVLYPLQTFSAERAVDFYQVPLCYFAPDATVEQDLLMLARRLSQAVYRVDDAQRAVLHLAAVFANNFTNHCYTVAHDLLAQHQLPFALLQPLIVETAAKVQSLPPERAQTGPAQRGDHSTIDRHLAQLAGHPDWQRVYRLLSELIEKSNRSRE